MPITKFNKFIKLTGGIKANKRLNNAPKNMKII